MVNGHEQQIENLDKFETRMNKKEAPIVGGDRNFRINRILRKPRLFFSLVHHQLIEMQTNLNLKPIILNEALSFQTAE